METFKTFGKLFDVTTDSGINSANFAINCRVYDPENETAKFGENAGALVNMGNKDTAYGAPLFHENRCIGKAVFAHNFETLNQDSSVISGLNTIQNRPFEVTVRTESKPLEAGKTGEGPENVAAGKFPRASTMFVFCHYDLLIQIRPMGVSVLGRG